MSRMATLVAVLMTVAAGLGFWIGVKLIAKRGFRIDGGAPLTQKIPRAFLIVAAIWLGAWIADLKMNEPIQLFVPILFSLFAIVLIFRGTRV